MNRANDDEHSDEHNNDNITSSQSADSRSSNEENGGFVDDQNDSQDDENPGLMLDSPSSPCEELQQQQEELSNGNHQRLANTNIPRVCCALLASIVTGGVTYAFGLYGAALKSTLHLTQTQLDTISSATFCAGLLSWLPGMFVDRFGTRLGIVLGGITGSTSMILYWSVSTRLLVIDETNVIVGILSILGITTFVSCALITGSVFKIISCNCGPGTKGSAVGVAKGYVGLGSGAFACLFESIRTPTSSDLDFLPMGAFLFLACASIPSWCFMEKQQHPVPDVLTPLHFRVLFVSLLCLAAVVVGSALMNLYKQEHGGKQATSSGEPEPNYYMTFLILTVWIGPLVMQLFLPRKNVAAEEAIYSMLLEGGEEDQDRRDTNQIVSDDENEEDISSSSSRSSLRSIDAEGFGDEVNDTAGEFSEVQDKNLFQMLQSPSAWILLWISTMIVGGGTVETNNLGQMVESLKFPSAVTAASLSLFSVAQSGGRVLTGVVSENALNWNIGWCCIDKGVPRPFFLIITSLVGVIAHAILAFSADQTSFMVGTALSGLSFGGVWPMLVLIVGEIYGTAHVAANYMFYDGVTSAGGTFLLSKIVAQRVYESHIDQHYSDNDDSSARGVTCYGLQCFQTTHIVISISLITCAIMSVIFMYMTRHVYNKAASQPPH